MIDIRSILSKKISLIAIALLIGAAAIAYNLKGKNVIPRKTTVQAKDQNNNGLKIYDDTITINDSIVGEEEFPIRRLPI